MANIAMKKYSTEASRALNRFTIPIFGQTQEQRALRSLQSIFGGADLTAETMRLANEFTDRQSGRLTGWLRRRRHEPD